jgi:hypothetical protein
MAPAPLSFTAFGSPLGPNSALFRLTNAAILQPQHRLTRSRLSPEPMKNPPERGFREVGGTGLEPVTPSLSSRGNRPVPARSVLFMRGRPVRQDRTTHPCPVSGNDGNDAGQSRR